MAVNYKNIIITPNIGNTAEPRIQFSGGNTTVNTDINLYVYPDANGTLSFEGSAGQLFSITNDLSNLIFSVSDVSGIPSLEVYANGLVSIAPFGGNVVFGNTSELILSPGTGIYANGGLGTAGQVLHSNGTSVYWAADDNSGTVTSVASANGIGGGTITATGTLYAVAGNSTVFVNATGIHVNTAALPADGVTSVASGNGLTGGTITGTGTLSALANTGIVANSTGLFVNATYISSIAWPINGAATDANTATQGIWRLNTGIPNQPSGTDYGTLLTFDNNSDTGFQLASDYAGSNFYWRSGNPAVFGGAGSFATWKKLLHDSNYNSYAPTLTGTGASGTWGISITGSAASATTATTATNATQLGGVAAASYQLNSTLSANVATMTANNATNLGGVAAANYKRSNDQNQVDIAAPASSTGTWTTASPSDEWGNPKFDTTFNKYTYADAPATLQFNVPAGMKSAWLSQLCWSTGGYVDVHGVQSGGQLVFLRRINTRQTVENTDEGVNHDGSTITFVASGLDDYSAIRLTVQSGRFHLTGLSFSSSDNEGTEGVGMVHPAQISYQGAGSTLDADLLDGNHASAFQTTAGLSANVATLSANNASFLGGVAAANYARTDTADSFDAVVTFNANTIFTKSMSANGSFGTAGQVLTSGAAGNVYWTTPTTGTVTSVATGTGLTGGPVTTTGTISLATAGAGAATYSSGISALSVDAYGRVTSVTGSAGYVTSSGVTSVASGNGIIGGTITATGTLYVDGANGISVDASGVNVLAGNSQLVSNATGLWISQGQIDHNSLSNYVADRHIAHSGVAITAGNGLTGGGNIDASRTLNVGAGNGITVGADSVSVTAGSGVVVNATGVHVSASIIDNMTDEHRLFNNMGDSHATRTAFDATNPSYNFGWRFVQGSTNGPGVNGAGQYYSEYVGLGNDYAATGAGSYGMQIAYPRNVTTPYIAIRYNEANVLGAWQKISAGYADSSGSATTASQIDGIDFYNGNSTNPVSGADNLTNNGIAYVSSVSLFSQTDGALYSQAYSTSWVHQLFGDYRTGQIAIRGKNSGTWQAWRTVLDSTNYTSYAPTLTGTGASGSWGISITGSAASATTATTATNATQLGGVAAASYQLNSTLSANVATMTANNATNLGGVAAASYVQNTDSRTLSGNLVFTGANTTVNAVFRVVNTTANVLFVAANGNIGIGNTTPGHNLVIQKAAGASTAGELRITDGGWWSTFNSRQLSATFNPLVQGGDHTIIYSDGTIESGAFTVAPWSASNKGFRITADGNIGIANATPAHTLRVQGDISLSGGVHANGSFGTAGQVLTTNGTTSYWAPSSVTRSSAIAMSILFG